MNELFDLDILENQPIIVLTTVNELDELEITHYYDQDVLISDLELNQPKYYCIEEV